MVPRPPQTLTPELSCPEGPLGRFSWLSGAHLGAAQTTAKDLVVTLPSLREPGVRATMSTPDCVF